MEANFQLDFEQINEAETQRLQQDPKLIRFVEWVQKNGARISGIDLQAAFGALGVPGVLATEDLPANKVIIALPIRLIPNLDSAQQSAIAPMLKQNPKFFERQDNPEFNYCILTAWILYERLQGDDSFWAPYFDIVTNTGTLLDWNENDIKELDCQHLQDQYRQEKQKMDGVYAKFKQIFAKHPELYPPQKLSDKLIRWSYQFVETRCYGSAIPSTCLLPICDLLNHRSRDSTNHQLTKLDFESKQKQAPQIYQMVSENLDFAIFEREDLQKSPQKLEAIRRINNEMFNYIQNNKKYISETYLQKGIDFDNLAKYKLTFARELVNDINANHLKLETQSQIWDLKFETTSDAEQNGTSEDEKLQRKLKLKELQLFELEKIEQITLAKNPDPTQEDQKNEQVLQYIANLKKNFLEDIAKDQQALQEANKDSDDETENKPEQVKKQGSNEGEQQIQQSQNQGGDADESNSSDSDFDWYEEADEDIYVIIKTMIPHYKGEQVYNFYGRRTNRFLLMWYGFTFEDNHYDSYNFRLRGNLPDDPYHPDTMNKILFQKFIQDDEDPILNELTAEFKLKKSRIALDFLIYLRMYLIPPGIPKDACILTIPTSLEYELAVLDYYLAFLTFIRTNKFHTTYEEDQQIIDDIQSNYKLRFAAIIRKSHKEIIDTQISIVTSAFNVITLLKEGKTMKEAYNTNVEGFKTPRELIDFRHRIKSYLASLEQSRSMGLIEFQSL